MRLYAEKLWDGSDAKAVVGRSLLSPAALVFGGVVRLRDALYDGGLFASEAASLPVLSVGNLRLGGSSKTPLVIWLAERLISAGRRPGVLMRGYGARRRGGPIVVVNGSAAEYRRHPEEDRRGFRVISLDERGAGLPAGVSDEAALVALRLQVPVVVSPDRALGCRVAVQIGCDVALLDDGFQHRRLRRDLDIVLVSSADLRACLLPAGPLREPLGALKRADVVVMTDGSSAPRSGSSKIMARAVPIGLVDRVAEKAVVASPQWLRSREILAVAGIARPQRFLSMLEAFGANIAASLIFPDHHHYRRRDWVTIERMAAPDRWVLTTEKDLVKLGPLAREGNRLRALRIDLRVDPEHEVLGRVAMVLDRLDAPFGRPHHRLLRPR